MAHLSVRLPESLIEELNALAEIQHQSKAELVREALELYRQHQTSLARKERLSKASFLVRANSMISNREFAAVEGEPNEA
jgi:metal-responsive CopG/Arc/MetJ family transcriptional regulator